MNEIVSFYIRWGGLLPLGGGIFFLLLASGRIPRRPKDPAAHRLWLQKSAPTLWLSGFVLLAFGIVTAIFGLPN